MAAFEKNVGPTNILPEGASCLDFFLLLFPEDEHEHDKLFHIRPLINKFTKTFRTAYNPNRENAIDEGLVKFKGRLAFKQYMPLKPAKRGIKVWLRADSTTHYVSTFQVYTGRPRQGEPEPECGLGARVVTELSRDLVGGFYHLFFDNFFSSFN